jgi:nucleotide-binding universal stress UspA family protein
VFDSSTRVDRGFRLATKGEDWCMLGSIVCCVDDSAESRDAARVAKGLATRLDLELILLHVAPPLTQPGVSAAAFGQERLAESERADAEALLERVAGEAGVGDVERRVALGPPAERILAVCEQEQPEMVVLGSRRHGSLKAALLGSVSADVAGKAPCLVVIVPSGAAGRTSLA